MKAEREEQFMQQPTCSICDARVPRVVRVTLTVECARFDAQLGMSRSDHHPATVRICAACAEHCTRVLA